MRTVFAIFKRDLLRILKNPVGVIVTLGVALIPALYAWFNIAANWDPYNNTSGILVAVASEDQDTQIEGMGEVNVGDLVIEELKDNDQLGWRFVTKDEALEGVESGAYYAAIVIPADFSKDMASVLTGDLVRPQLDYYVNEKLNPVAPKVTDTGADTVESQIDEQFVSTVADVVLDKAQTVAGHVEADATDVSGSIAGQVREAANQVALLPDSLAHARSTCSTASTAIDEGQEALDKLSEKAATGREALEDALGDLSSTRSSATAGLTSLSGDLAQASGTLTGISSQTASDISNLAADLTRVQGAVDAALSKLQAVQDSLQATKSQLDSAIDSLPDATVIGSGIKDSLTSQAEKLQDQLDSQQALIDKLQSVSDTIKNAASQVSNDATSADQAIQSAASALSSLQSTLGTDALPQVDSALDDLSSAGGLLDGQLGSLDGLVASLKNSLAQLTAILDQADQALALTEQSAQDLASTLQDLASDLSAVASAANLESLSSILDLNKSDIADVIGSPVTIEERSVFPVENYGSGVTPFYTNLALFVGGFCLVSIYKLEVDEDGIGPIKPWQGYFGRWMLLNLVGILQALITCIGDLALGIQCLSPGAFIFAGLVESFVYVNMIYALAVAFKHIGKALAVIIVILEIPGSSGLYPIQMQPEFFQALHPWLPFTYGNNAMREAIAGFYDGYYLYDLGMLLLFVVPSLLIGVVLRRYLLNINGLFDRRLRETDLMACERDAVPAGNFRLTTLIKAALDSDEYRRVFEERAERFELLYPVLIKGGLIAMLCCFGLLLIPLFVVPTDAKLPVLVAWVVSVVLLCAFLLVVEYFHSRVSEKIQLTEQSRQQLMQMVGDRLHAEFGAFAPASKMRGLSARLHHWGSLGRHEADDSGLDVETPVDEPVTLGDADADATVAAPSDDPDATVVDPDATAAQSSTPPADTSPGLTVPMPTPTDRDDKTDPKEDTHA